MPMQQEKFVPIAHILRVYVHFKFWMSSQWGLSDTKTWWSKDNSRVKGCSCIIIRTGSMMMKGFSPNAGNPETVKEVGDLLQKIVPGGPGMVQYIGY